MKLTVLTPTYNRAHKLLTLYESLKKQTNSNFQWLIIDDGSTDDTEMIVNDFIDDGGLDIQYFKKTNGGKHTALNYSHQYIDGELVIIVDSDDYLIDTAVQTIFDYWEKYIDNENIGVITFLRGFANGKPFAKKFKEEVTVANFIDFRINKKLGGDYCEVIRSDLFKNYSFPEYQNEKYVPEGCLWINLSKTHDMVFVNEIVYISEYLEGGLTKQGRVLRINNPEGQMCYAKLLLTTKEVCMSKKIKAAWLYTCYGLFAGKSIKDIIRSSECELGIIVNLPISIVLFLYLKKR